MHVQDRAVYAPKYIYKRRKNKRRHNTPPSSSEKELSMAQSGSEPTDSPPAQVFQLQRTK